MLLQYSVLCQFCTPFPPHCSKLQHVQCCATCAVSISVPSKEMWIVTLRFLQWCCWRLQCFGMLLLCWSVSTNVLMGHWAFMFRIKLLDHEHTGTMLLQNIRNHLLNDTHNLTVVTVCRSYLVIWKVSCVATVLMFGNGVMKLLFVPSLAAEQGTENDCKEVSHVWTFHFLLRKAPWESCDLMHEGLCNHVTSYGTVCWWMNAICGGGKMEEMLLVVVCLQPWQMRVVERVGAVPEEDGSITWTAVAADMGISTVSMFCILLKQVGRRKVCAKWIPCILNEDQQATCVMLVNVYFQWWRSIPCPHFDSAELWLH